MLNPVCTHTSTLELSSLHWVIGCFWQLGVFNVTVGLWNTWPGRKIIAELQKLNLFPFPALFSSLLRRLSLTACIRSLPFPPFPLCCGLPLPFCCLTDVIRGLASAPLNSRNRALQSKNSQVTPPCPLHRYFLHPSIFPKLPFFMNRQVTVMINVGVNHPQQAAFNLSPLLCMSSELVGGCFILCCPRLILAYSWEAFFVRVSLPLTHRVW